MDTLGIILIYIIGIPIAYQIERWSIKKDFGKWTAGTRRAAILISFLSWADVLINLLVRSVDLFDNDTPAG